MKPVISIIVPVYNVEDYISGCLDSILHQDFVKWECILINDGSKDKSGDICEEYAFRDKRFKVSHKNNRGVSAARNAGLALATGDWICFVDSDDTLVDSALSHMFQLVSKTGADVCICPIVQKESCKQGTKILSNKEQETLIWSCLAYRTKHYADNGFMVDAPHAKLFKASIINENCLRFVEGLCKSEDALFDAQFYRLSDKIVIDSFPVYRYTYNPNSICHNYKIENIPMFEILLKQEEDFVNKAYKGSKKFEEVINIRAFVALEQVLYESDADKMAISERVAALRLFMENEFVNYTISRTKYSQIKPYMQGRSRRVDLLLIKYNMYRALCFWADFHKSALDIRVFAVDKIKRLFHLNSETSLSSLILRR